MADKGGRYHHGDLRAALIDAAAELIDRHGLDGFSLAEASRRLGVTAAAPYSHFPDRDALVAAVTTRAAAQLADALTAATRGLAEPSARLSAVARAQVLFAAAHPGLYASLIALRNGKDGALEHAVRPVVDAIDGPARQVTDGSEARAQDLALAAVALAHGYASLLPRSPTPAVVRSYADKAARGVLALAEDAASAPPSADPSAGR